MVTVKQCMNLPALHAGIVAAGSLGMGRCVHGTHVVDEADVQSWISPDVIVMTTGHNFPHHAEEWGQLIETLADGGVAALMLATGRYFPKIPEAAAASAEERNLPLIELPWELPFVSVSQAIYELLLNDHTRAWERLASMQIELAEAATKAGTLDEMVYGFSRLLHFPVHIVKYNSPQAEGELRFPILRESVSPWTISLSGRSRSPESHLLGLQMAALCGVFLLQEHVSQQARWEMQTAWLNRLLDGDGLDDPIWTARAESWGFSLQQPVSLLVVSPGQALDYPKVPGGLSESEQSRLLIRQCLSRQRPLMADGGSHFVILMPTCSESSLRTDLSPYFRTRTQSQAALTEAVSLRNVAPAFRAALAVLPLAPPQTVTSVSHLLFPKIVASIHETLMRPYLAATWGRVSDAELRKTLSALVDTGGNHREAAVLLGVHRNTIRNRIQAIEAILGQSLTPAVLAQLQVSLWWDRSHKGNNP